jgi:hypothetical protein
MADYKLILDSSAAFVVDIATTSGHQSMRRFSTEAEAFLWIAEKEFHEAAVESVNRANGNQPCTSLS